MQVITETIGPDYEALRHGALTLGVIGAVCALFLLGWVAWLLSPRRKAHALVLAPVIAGALTGVALSAVGLYQMGQQFQEPIRERAVAVQVNRPGLVLQRDADGLWASPLGVGPRLDLGDVPRGTESALCELDEPILLGPGQETSEALRHLGSLGDCSLSSGDQGAELNR